MNVTTTNAEPTMVDLLAGVATETRELVAAHAKQMRAEMAAEMLRARFAAIALAMGSSLASIGLAFIFVAFIRLLTEQAGWPAWAAWLAEGGAVLALGVTLLSFGWRRWHALSPLPTKSLQSVHESLQWISNN